jgi:hypothetical protein
MTRDPLSTPDWPAIMIITEDELAMVRYDENASISLANHRSISSAALARTAFMLAAASYL